VATTSPSAKWGLEDMVNEWLKVTDRSAVKYNVAGEDSKSCALILASSDGREVVVRYLIESGADVHAISISEPRGGMFPVASAAESGHLSLVRLLLGLGADVGQSSRLGNALALATEMGHAEIAELLVKSGVDIWTSLGGCNEWRANGNSSAFGGERCRHKYSTARRQDSSELWLQNSLQQAVAGREIEINMNMAFSLFFEILFYRLRRQYNTTYVQSEA
jgi:hypothetical protein